MGLESFADIHRYNKELLDDDYNHGQALVVKTKARGNDGAVSGHLKIKGRFLRKISDEEVFLMK